MERTMITYPSFHQGSTITAYIWKPEQAEDLKKVKGIIQICHGMAEYILRYEKAISIMVEQGFILCGNDHLGHGLSKGKAYGYMGDKDGHLTLANDAYALTKHVKLHFPDLPYILFGHSMGSFVARTVASFWGNEYFALILSGTSSGVGGSEILGGLFHMIGKIKGSTLPGNFADKMMSTSSNKKFEAENDSLAWLSRDVAERDLYRKDPLCGFVFTWAGYAALMKIISYVSSTAWYQSIPVSLPIYLFSGAQDPIGKYGKGVYKVYKKLFDHGCDKVEIKLYQEARHEMFFELNKEQAIMDVIDWVNKIL